MAMVRELPVDERPRERLLALGPGFLSNAELLAIVLRNGSKERSALQLAQDILSLYKDDGVSALGRMTAGELMCLQGIGSAKAAEVMAAVEKLKKMGLKVGAVFEENAKEPAGTVINQDPRSGSKITKGQSVDITVSLGEKKKDLTVQNYAGLSVESAKSNLEANGLSLGSVTEEASSKPKGTVISQSPAAGSTVTEGGSVSLVISSGKAAEPEKQPSAPTESPATAKQKTDSSKLTIKLE